MNTELQSETVKGAPEVSHLDSDTQRGVKAIFRNGYYELHQGLGVGGWPIVYSFANDWRTYVLAAQGEEPFDDTIVAKDDETARKAFANKYDLDNCAHQIREKTVTMRDICLQTKGA